MRHPTSALTPACPYVWVQDLLLYCCPHSFSQHFHLQNLKGHRMAKSQLYVRAGMLQGRKIKVFWGGFCCSVTYLYNAHIGMLFFHWNLKSTSSPLCLIWPTGGGTAESHVHLVLFHRNLCFNHRHPILCFWTLFEIHFLFKKNITANLL